MGVSVQVGSLSRGVSVGRSPGIRKAGGTHPTGILSCFSVPFVLYFRQETEN